uniref:Uncharacterized protein n=1 Tax=Panagrolaimus sp. PS1159 TaxID=55785 RepID=A0AC35FKZ0_9BILA
MKNILENENINLSEKNALYNNILRQFIKKLKGAAEKPLDVNVSNESIPFKNDDLTNSMQQLSTALQNLQANYPAPATPKKKKKNATPPPTPNNTETQTDLNNTFVTPKPNLEKKKKVPSAPRKQKSQPLFDTSSDQKRERKRKADKTQTTNDQIVELSHHLLQNRDKFNLNEKGQIVDQNNGQVIPGSNYVDVAEYLVKGSVGATTPKGFKKIDKLLNEDDNVRRFKIKNWAK